MIETDVTVAVRVTDLSYSYPDGTVALHKVNLDVSAGERIAVLGPNGAGKSTLMLQLNGVLTATAGSVRIGDTILDGKTVRQGCRSENAAAQHSRQRSLAAPMCLSSTNLRRISIRSPVANSPLYFSACRRRF